MIGRPGVALLGLMLFGLAIRIPGLADPPLRFHPTRQYRSALMARAEYLASQNATGPRSEAARAAGSLFLIEPPLQEQMAAWAYRLRGREDLALARLLVVFAWMAGTWALWVAARCVFDAPAAVASVAVMLFLPFSIPASQAFQPDALMATLSLATVAVALRARSAVPIAAVLFGAAALFVKPMAMFFFLPAVVVLSVRRAGCRRGLAIALFASVAMALPAVAYYMLWAPAAGENRMFPQLLVTAQFWYDWLRMLTRVATGPGLLAAVIGLVAARREVRVLLGACWAGYVVFGLLFTHHIHTHDYYSLPVIPLVALCIGALADAAWRTVPDRFQGRVAAAGAIVILIGGLTAAVSAGALTPDVEARREAARYARIGEAVAHSSNVVSLDGNYGYPLSYHGWTHASNMPLSIDRAVFYLTGQADDRAGQLARLRSAEFFVGTSQAELDAQPDLAEALRERYTLIARDGTEERWNYVVYDLRRLRATPRPERLSMFVPAAGGPPPTASVSVMAEPDVRWRVTALEPGVIAVAPSEGTGTAELRVRMLQVPAEDRTLHVMVAAPEGGDTLGHLQILYRRVELAPDARPFGWVDIPSGPVAVGSEPILFAGWALDPVNLKRVWVGCLESSGSFREVAETRPRGARPDVAKFYPRAHDIYNAAWTIMLRPDACAGSSKLHFFAESGDGRRAEIGTRTLRK